MIDGIVKFRDEFSGKLLLEIFLIDGFNTGTEQLESLREIAERICPDKIQLNTAVRPTSESGISPISPERLEELKKFSVNLSI